MPPRAQLEFPPDHQTEAVLKQVLDRSLPAKIMDILWHNIFHFFTWFEGIDGYLVTTSGSGTATAGEAGLNLTTDTAVNAVTSVEKQPVYFVMENWQKRSRMRTSFTAGQTDTNFESRIVIGQTDTGATRGINYGFRIEGATLQGICSTSSTESRVNLDTALTLNGAYVCEAQYDPFAGIIFGSTASNGDSVITRGSLYTNLPSSDTDAAFNDNQFFEVKIQTKAVASKSITVGGLEYIQEK